MQFYTLLITIFLSSATLGQPVVQHNLSKQRIYFNQPNVARQKNMLISEIKLQEIAFVRYKRDRLNCFILIESILNELFKPEPTINKHGFHYNANPYLEIKETKGNTGFIKFGVMINLGLR